MALGRPNVVYGVLCLGRLILGIGVGGIYPLSAVAAAEGAVDSARRGRRVAGAFFWQSPGVLAPYLFAMVMLASIGPHTPAEWVPQLEFRLLFAVGVIPAAIIFMASLREGESEQFISAQAAGRTHQTAIAALRAEPSKTRWTLAGTAGSWFLWDIVYYGTGVFTPLILQDICMAGEKIDGECQQSLLQTAWQSCIFYGHSWCTSGDCNY